MAGPDSRQPDGAGMIRSAVASSAGTEPPHFMRPIHIARLLLLSFLWGGAYLFMRSAAPAFGPFPMVFLRMAMGSLLVLLPLTLWRTGLAPMRAHWRGVLIFGSAFTALPFLGLGFSALSISAGMLAVLQSTAPLFSAIVAHVWLRERITPMRALLLAVTQGGRRSPIEPRR